MKLKLALVVLGIGLLVGSYYAFGLGDVVTLSSVQEHKEQLQDAVASRPVISVALFAVVYYVSVTLSLPFAAILSLLSGFLFGVWLGTAVSVITATLGAATMFVATKKLFGEQMQKKYGERLQTIMREIDRNGFNHLLFLRLVPVFPFFLINIAAAFTTMKLPTFVAATVLGIIPGSFAYVYAGTSLGTIEQVGDVLSPQVITALVLLAGISLVPVVLKKVRKQKPHGEQPTDTRSST